MVALPFKGVIYFHDSFSALTLAINCKGTIGDIIARFFF